MNISENARALRRGLLVILLHGLRQTPRNNEYTKKFRAFLCVTIINSYRDSLVFLSFI